MKNKARRLPTEEQNRKGLRLVIRLLIPFGAFVLLGTAFITGNWFVKDLYTAFIVEFIGTSFLYAGGLMLLFFFITTSAIIVFKNPQQINSGSRLNFAILGLGCLILAVLLAWFSGNETKKAVQDIKAYSEGDWHIEDLQVISIYRGSDASNGILIETEAGEMYVPNEKFWLYKGETYRFTYLDKTRTVINVESMPK